MARSIQIAPGSVRNTTQQAVWRSDRGDARPTAGQTTAAMPLSRPGERSSTSAAASSAQRAGCGSSPAVAGIGSSSPERQEAKFRFLDAFLPHLAGLRAEGREIVLCGDWNIAHREIDLRNWRGNQKNSGFLPEERAWLTQVYDELGFVDAFRVVDQRPEQYTWWSNRGQAWAKNVGWRIDYQIATPGIAARALRASIYKRKRFSDHAPLTIDYDWAL